MNADSTIKMSPDKLIPTLKSIEAQFNVQIENSVFKIETDNGPDIYYIPVYPRAYLQEIEIIDNDRRTVSAKFVVMITVSLMNLQDQQIRKFVEQHLIIQFGYNQVIYIPEHITLQNSPYLINKVINTHADDNFVTYRIKGRIQCNAYFDLRFFPYRKIEVENNLCLRSQIMQLKRRQQDKQCRQVVIKYNMMTLMEEEDMKYKQFIPYSLREKFGPYQLQWKQNATIASQKSLNTIVNADVFNTVKYIFSKALSLKTKQKEPQKNLQHEKKEKMILDSIIQVGKKEKELQHKLNEASEETGQIGSGWREELHPYKHMVFKFEMRSMQIPFLMQQQIPIWVITVITLFLFHSSPSIGSKYGCIILLLISFLAVVSDFRRNYISEPNLTFFQLKLLSLLIVPILLIVSTQKDYYDIANFDNRTNQTENPFFIASVLISLISFVFTFVALAVIAIIDLVENEARSKYKTNKAEQMIDWMNMIELKWGNPELKKRLHQLCRNKSSGIKFLQPELDQSLVALDSTIQYQLSSLLPPKQIGSFFQLEEPSSLI